MIMESQRFNEGTAKINGCVRGSSAEQKIDLTLRLGLPTEIKENENEDSNSPEIGQLKNLDFDQMAPTHGHRDIDGLHSHEGINHNKPKNMQSFNPKEVAWPPPMLLGHFSYCAPTQNLHQSNNGYNFSPFSGSSMGSIPLYSNTNLNYYHQCHHNSNNFNINLNNNTPATATSTATMNEYTLLNVPSRRANREVRINIGSSSSSLAAASTLSRRTAAIGGGLRRQYGRGMADPFKRCTNYYCNTNDTPMWRKGPLGPKTLCNACGIKYRKEEQKRRAKAAIASNKSDSGDSNTPTGSGN